MASFKNTAPGARGVRTKAGELVMIEPGQSADVDVSDAELKDAEATGYFEIDGASTAEPGPLDGSIEDLETHVAGVDDPAEIDRLIAAETAGKSRKGAIAVLEARRDQLLA